MNYYESLLNESNQGYTARIADCQHKEGLYNGCFMLEDNELWFQVETPDGDVFETVEQPMHYIDLRDVQPLSGTIQQVTTWLNADRGTIN